MNTLYRSLFILFLFVAATGGAVAQWSQSIVDVKTDRFPVIDVHVATRQNQALVRTIDSSMFRLTEDGHAQSPLSLTFEGPQRGFSISVVIPVSSSMTAGDLSAATGLALRLVDRMNGITDECAIYDGAQERQQMTHVKPFLITALQSLQTGGPEVPLWQGVYDAVSAGLGGTNPDRAIIMISNGRGGPGNKSFDDVVNLAKNGGIKVHCYGVNAVNNDQQMRDLSRETGGTYYSNTDLLVQEVIDNLTGQPQYGVLSYTTSNRCRDGIARDLSVRFRLNNDSVTTTQQFPLTADASTGVTVNVAVDTASITSGASRNVALKVSPAVQGQRLYPGTITLTFDTGLLTLSQAITAGTLSAGMNASVTPTASGATVTLTNSVDLNGSGNLLFLKFTAGDVTGNTDAQVGISSIQFDRGCISTQLSAGRITVRPKNAALTITSAPVVFNWNSTSGRYSPDPAVVSVEITNTGDVPVTALTARLADSPDIRMAYGAVSDVVVVPDSLAPGNKGTAVFYVQALPVSTERTAQVGITVTGNPVIKTGTLFFNIKAAESAVRTNARVDEIRVQGGNYTPDPATFTAAVHAIGTQASPGGTVKLDLPGGVTVGSSETQGFTSMQPNDSTVLVWSLQYPKDGTAASYIIGVITEATGKTPDTSYVTMFVPELQGEQLTASCSITPMRLLWSPSTGSYTPTEAELTVTVENTGTVEANGVQATVLLPNGLILSPAEMASKVIGDIPPGITKTATWKLRSPGLCADADLQINVTVLSQGGPSQQCSSTIFVESSNSGAPTVTRSTPARFDTLDRGAAVTFIVEAVDPDRALLLYQWGVNGVFEPARPDSTYSKSFETNGQFEVVCRIIDPCAASGLGDTTFVIWNFTVRSSLGTIPLANAGDFAILGNYPNPFNPGTMVEYQLPQGRRHVRLDVVDASGRAVRTLIDEEQQGGRQQVYFDASGMTSGVYLLRLQSGQAVRTHQVTLIK